MRLEITSTHRPDRSVLALTATFCFVLSCALLEPAAGRYAARRSVTIGRCFRPSSCATLSMVLVHPPGEGHEEDLEGVQGRSTHGESLSDKLAARSGGLWARS